MNDLVDHNLSEDKEDEPIDIPPADAHTVLSAAATSAAATAVKDVINAEVLDDNDSVVHWIGKTIKTFGSLKRSTNNMMQTGIVSGLVATVS